MPTAPTKYVDRDRTIVTPEWLAWRKEALALAAEDAPYILMQGGNRPDTYLPEGDGKAIPEDGAWIIVLEEPMTELRDRFRVPFMSMWRARPHTLDSGGVQVSKDVTLYPKQAVITTPGGDLHLWAHEYVMATDPFRLISDPDATINSLGGEPVLDEEAMFYLRSRGIPHSEAVLLLIETVKSTDFIYVTFPEEVTNVFNRKAG